MLKTKQIPSLVLYKTVTTLTDQQQFSTPRPKPTTTNGRRKPFPLRTKTSSKLQNCCHRRKDYGYNNSRAHQPKTKAREIRPEIARSSGQKSQFSPTAAIDTQIATVTRDNMHPSRYKHRICPALAIAWSFSAMKIVQSSAQQLPARFTA